MKILNVEIKAQVPALQQESIRDYLTNKKADFKGVDHQIDTYFKVENGRLKLRQGNIECSLIGYERGNQASSKRSDVALQKLTAAVAAGIKQALSMTSGVQAVVDKHREIFFIDNVKFHLDKVDGLGTFVEIEAIDDSGIFSEEDLRKQCDFYQQELGIAPNQLITHSYSDMPAST